MSDPTRSLTENHISMENTQVCRGLVWDVSFSVLLQYVWGFVFTATLDYRTDIFKISNLFVPVMYLSILFRISNELAKVYLYALLMLQLSRKYLVWHRPL